MDLMHYLVMRKAGSVTTSGPTLTSGRVAKKTDPLFPSSPSPFPRTHSTPNLLITHSVYVGVVHSIV